jgi:hypothetical protein
MMAYKPRLSIAELRQAIEEAMARHDYATASHYQIQLSTLLWEERLYVAREKVVGEWRLVGPVRHVRGSGEIILDRGEYGTVTLVPDSATTAPSMRFRGIIARDPEVLIFTAMHAKKHWKSTVISKGDPEFVFLSTVALELVGAKVPRFSTATLADRLVGARPLFSLFNIPLRRRAGAEALKKQWQPIYERLLAQQSAPAGPGRPEHGRRSTAPPREAAVA